MVHVVLTPGHHDRAASPGNHTLPTRWLADCALQSMGGRLGDAWAGKNAEHRTHLTFLTAARGSETIQAAKPSPLTLLHRRMPHGNRDQQEAVHAQSAQGQRPADVYRR